MKNEKNTSLSLPDAIVKILASASMIYTLFTVLFYLAGPLFDLGDRYMVLSRKSAFLLLAFSLIISLANLLLTSKKLKMAEALRIFLHFVITAGAFYVLFLDISGYDAGKSSTIVLLLVYTVVYFIICGIVYAIRGTRRRKAENASEYTSIYNK